MKRIEFRCRWITRRAGGLFAGLRVDFPTTIVYEPVRGIEDRRSVVHLTFGFLLFAVTVEIRSKQLTD